ncbi:MAG: TatD family hydrolase [Terracidiphilus sp.]
MARFFAPVTLIPDAEQTSDTHSEALLLIDSHAHLDSPRYADDREAMLRRAAEAGVGTVLSIGIGECPAEMHQALDLCRQFNGRPGLPRLYASAGIYPHSTPEADETALAKLDALLAEPEVIACGEIGLDYYHEGAPREVQRQGLISQLEIAAARRRPILVHCRGTNESTDAWDDLFLVLDEHWRKTGLGGIMHCFGAGWEQARRSLDMGFLVSFAGNLTYVKAQPLRDVAVRMPLDGILVETDAPWLAPVPQRGQRNEPAFVAQTAQALAGLLGVSEAEIAAVTTKNFNRLFQLRPDVGH